MSVSFKVEDVNISAIRDRAMFDTFAGNSSYIVKDIGDELEVTYSSSSFVVTLGTGEAVICGGSMVSEGVANQITLSNSESGYVVIEIDLSQTGTNICQFKNVASLTQENINDGVHNVYDLPLYSYVTDNSGVQNMTDLREISATASVGVITEDTVFDISGSEFKLTGGTNIGLSNSVKLDGKSIKAIESVWSNSSYASNFNAQDVAMDLSPYFYVVIMWRIDKTEATYSTDIMKVRHGSTTTTGYVCTAYSDYNGGNGIPWRKIVISDSKITFNQGFISNFSGSKGSDNSRMIPFQVWGIKLGG